MKNQGLQSFPTTITLPEVKEFIRQCDLCFYALLPDFHQKTSGKPGFSALLAISRAIDALPLSRNYAPNVQRFRQALLALVSDQVQSYYDAYDGVRNFSDDSLRSKDTHIKRQFNTLMLFEGGQMPEDKTGKYQNLVKDLNAAHFSLDLEYNEQRHQVYGKFSVGQTQQLKEFLADYHLEFKASSVSNDFHVSCMSEKYDPEYEEEKVQALFRDVNQEGLSIHFDGMSYMYPDFNSRLQCILRADITVPELAKFREQLGASAIPEAGFHLSLVTEKRAPEPVLQGLIQEHGGRDHLDWSVILSGDMQRKAYSLLHDFGILNVPLKKVSTRVNLDIDQQQELKALSASMSTDNTTQERRQANQDARDKVESFLRHSCPFLPERDIDVRYYLQLQLSLGVLASCERDTQRMYQVLTKVRRQLATFEYQDREQDNLADKTAHLFDPIRAEILYQWVRMRRFGLHLDSEDESLLSTLRRAIELRTRIDQDPQGCEDHKNALEVWFYRLNGQVLLHYLIAEDRYFLQPEALDHSSAKENIKKAQAIIAQVREFLSSQTFNGLVQNNSALTRSADILKQDCYEYEGKLQRLLSLLCDHKQHRVVLKKAMTSYENAYGLAVSHHHKEAGLEEALKELRDLDSSDSESDADPRALFFHQQIQAYHTRRYKELKTLAQMALSRRRIGFFDQVRPRIDISIAYLKGQDLFKDEMAWDQILSERGRSSSSLRRSDSAQENHAQTLNRLSLRMREIVPPKVYGEALLRELSDLIPRFTLSAIQAAKMTMQQDFYVVAVLWSESILSTLKLHKLPSLQAERMDDLIIVYDVLHLLQQLPFPVFKGDRMRVYQRRSQDAWIRIQWITGLTEKEAVDPGELPASDAEHHLLGNFKRRFMVLQCSLLSLQMANYNPVVSTPPSNPWKKAEVIAEFGMLVSSWSELEATDQKQLIDPYYQLVKAYACFSKELVDPCQYDDFPPLRHDLGDIIGLIDEASSKCKRRVERSDAKKVKLSWLKDQSVRVSMQVMRHIKNHRYLYAQQLIVEHEEKLSRSPFKHQIAPEGWFKHYKELKQSNKALIEAQLQSGLRLAGIDAYEKKELIGRGGYGKVYRGSYQGEVVAIKATKSLKNLSCELDVLSQLVGHDHIIALCAYCPQPSKDDGTYALILSFCGSGSLYDMLRDKSLPANAQSNILKQIAQGLAHIHRKGYIHADLSSSNVLLDRPPHKDKPYQVKIADFGLSHRESDVSKPKCASWWRAPELDHHHTSTKAGDIFSFGVIMWEVMSGLLPEAMMGEGTVLSETQYRDHLRRGQECVFPENRAALGSEVIALMYRCLSPDPQDRPVVDELCTFFSLRTVTSVRQTHGSRLYDCWSDDAVDPSIVHDYLEKRRAEYLQEGHRKSWHLYEDEGEELKQIGEDDLALQRFKDAYVVLVLQASDQKEIETRLLLKQANLALKLQQWGKAYHGYRCVLGLLNREDDRYLRVVDRLISVVSHRSPGRSWSSIVRKELLPASFVQTHSVLTKLSGFDASLLPVWSSRLAQNVPANIAIKELANLIQMAEGLSHVPSGDANYCNQLQLLAKQYLRLALASCFHDPHDQDTYHKHLNQAMDCYQKVYKKNQALGDVYDDLSAFECFGHYILTQEIVRIHHLLGQQDQAKTLVEQSVKYFNHQRSHHASVPLFDELIRRLRRLVNTPHDLQTAQTYQPVADQSVNRLHDFSIYLEKQALQLQFAYLDSLAKRGDDIQQEDKTALEIQTANWFVSLRNYLDQAQALFAKSHIAQRKSQGFSDTVRRYFSTYQSQAPFYYALRKQRFYLPDGLLIEAHLRDLDSRQHPKKRLSASMAIKILLDAGYLQEAQHQEGYQCYRHTDKCLDTLKRGDIIDLPETARVHIELREEDICRLRDQLLKVSRIQIASNAKNLSNQLSITSVDPNDEKDLNLLCQEILDSLSMLGDDKQLADISYQKIPYYMRGVISAYLEKAQNPDKALLAGMIKAAFESGELVIPPDAKTLYDRLIKLPQITYKTGKPLFIDSDFQDSLSDEQTFSDYCREHNLLAVDAGQSIFVRDLMMNIKQLIHKQPIHLTCKALNEVIIAWQEQWDSEEKSWVKTTDIKKHISSEWCWLTELDRSAYQINSAGLQQNQIDGVGFDITINPSLFAEDITDRLSDAHNHPLPTDLLDFLESAQDYRRMANHQPCWLDALSTLGNHNKHFGLHAEQIQSQVHHKDAGLRRGQLKIVANFSSKYVNHVMLAEILGDAQIATKVSQQLQSKQILDDKHQVISPQYRDLILPMLQQGSRKPDPSKLNVLKTQLQEVLDGFALSNMMIDNLLSCLLNSISARAHISGSHANQGTINQLDVLATVNEAMGYAKSFAQRLARLFDRSVISTPDTVHQMPASRLPQELLAQHHQLIQKKASPDQYSTAFEAFDIDKFSQWSVIAQYYAAKAMDAWSSHDLQPKKLLELYCQRIQSYLKTGHYLLAQKQCVQAQALIAKMSVDQEISPMLSSHAQKLSSLLADCIGQIEQQKANYTDEVYFRLHAIEERFDHTVCLAIFLDHYHQQYHARIDHTHHYMAETGVGELLVQLHHLIEHAFKETLYQLTLSQSLDNKADATDLFALPMLEKLKHKTQDEFEYWLKEYQHPGLIILFADQQIRESFMEAIIKSHRGSESGDRQGWFTRLKARSNQIKHIKVLTSATLAEDFELFQSTLPLAKGLLQALQAVILKNQATSKQPSISSKHAQSSDTDRVEQKVNSLVQVSSLRGSTEEGSDDPVKIVLPSECVSEEKIPLLGRIKEDYESQDRFAASFVTFFKPRDALVIEEKRSRAFADNEQAALLELDPEQFSSKCCCLLL